MSTKFKRIVEIRPNINMRVYSKSMSDRVHAVSLDEFS